MNNGVTYIEINYDSAWVNNAIAGVQGFSWLYEWGMYIFLLLTAAIAFWIFYDSITKKKDRKALVPRILAMVGFFAVIPAFIFRFTGNADGVTNLVRLNAEQGAPYYAGAINWNVNWLVAGYGPIIAIIALLGVLLSVIAIVIYASSVQRAKPSTEFVQAFDRKMSNLEDKVDDARRTAAKANESAKTKAGGTSTIADRAAKASGNATIIDRKPQAATIIDVPQTGDTLTVQSGGARGNAYNLPAKDVTIGRDPKNYITLDDGKVSREHAKLVYGNGTWNILDLGSVNGTYLNDQQVNGQQQLVNGDKIKIGDTILVFGQSQ